MGDLTRRQILAIVGGLSGSAATPSVSGSTTEKPWPVSRGDNRNTGTVTVESPLESLGVDWKTSLNLKGHFQAQPVFADQNLYVALSGGRILAIDATTGTVNWHSNDLPSDSNGLCLAGDLVFANTSRGNVYAFHRNDGSLAWKRSLGAAIDGDLALKDNTLFFGNEIGEVWALSATDGTTHWVNRQDRNMIDGLPAVVNNTLIVRPFHSELEALDLQTGTRLWKQPIQGEGGGFIAPVVDTSRVYIGGNRDEAGRVAALSVETGEPIWNVTLDNPVVWTPTMYDGSLVVSGSKGLHSLSRKDGSKQWEVDIGEPNATIKTKTGIYVTSKSGLRVLKPSTGSTLGKYKGSDKITYQAIPSRDRILLPTRDGEIIALAAGLGNNTLPEISMVTRVITGSGAVGLGALGYWVFKSKGSRKNDESEKN